jgi:hypothetical protein
MTETDDVAFERWAKKVGASPYDYPRLQCDAKGAGSPKWCRPAEGRRKKTTWQDGMRWYRAQTPAAREAKLLELHGRITGHSFVQMSDQNQLEVCRHCGTDLGLPRDDHGYVVRQFKSQRQYCSDRCEADADNRRDCQRRRGGKFPKDARSWYVNTPSEPARVRRHRVHVYDDCLAVGDYRLAWPWQGAPCTWRIVDRHAERARDAWRIPKAAGPRWRHRQGRPRME